MLICSNVRVKHAALRELMHSGMFEPAERAGLLVFATVRNPFDMLVSEYVNMRTRQLEEGRDPGWRRQRGVAARMKEDAIDLEFPDWVARWFGGRPREIAARDGRYPRRFGHDHYGRYYDGVDVVMRFEHLQDDFDVVLARLGFEPREIVAVGEGVRSPRRSFVQWVRDRLRRAA